MIKNADIVLDKKNGFRAIVIAANSENSDFGYLIAYLNMDSRLDNYQIVTDKEIEYKRKPTIDEIKKFQKIKNNLFDREVWKYENEYKDSLNSYETFVSNLQTYNLI